MIARRLTEGQTEHLLYELWLIRNHARTQLQQVPGGEGDPLHVVDDTIGEVIDLIGGLREESPLVKGLGAVDVVRLIRFLRRGQGWQFVAGGVPEARRSQERRNALGKALDLVGQALEDEDSPDAEVVADDTVDLVAAEAARLEALVTKLRRLQETLTVKSNECLDILHRCGGGGDSYVVGRSDAFENAVAEIEELLKADEDACDAARQFCAGPAD